MAVTIIGQTFYDVITAGSSGSNFPLFNIGESLLVWTDVEFFTEVKFTPAVPLVTGSALNQNHLYGSNRFANVSVGDTIRIVCSAGFFATVNNQKVTVLVKYSNNEILVSNAIVSGLPVTNNESNADAILYNLTEIQSLDYQYNFIENGQPNQFNSLTTNQLQWYKADNIDTSSFGTPSILVPQGGLEWQIRSNFVGTSDAYRISYDTSNGRQVFRIRHYVVATPLYLASQLIDATNNIAPTYYLNGNCLKYVVKVSGLRSINDPNSLQVVETNSSILGNSGWFDESFNQGAQDYFIQNIQYFNNGIPTTEISSFTPYDQTIEFDITSATGDFAVDQRISVGGMKLPNNQIEYQNNGRSLGENFLFADLYPYVNGLVYTNPYGNDGNFIDSVKADFINANTIHVTIYLVLNANTIAILNESLTPRFCFWTTIANPAFTQVVNSNKQIIWSGVKNFNNVVRPADLNCVQTFKRHYEDANDAGITDDITTFKNDECVMESLIYGTWEEFPSTVDSVYLTKIYQQVVAKRISDGAEFLLEDFQLNVPVIFQGGAPFINYSNNTVFNIPTTEIRKPITVTIVDAVPTPSSAKFKISYPFMIRWEAWVALLGVNSDFFNPSQPNNGQNQDWFHYLNANWEIYFRTGYDVVSSVNPYHFDEDILIPINDYATNPAYSVKKVETFTSGGTPLTAGGVNYIQAGSNTIVRATFTKPTGLLVEESKVVFGIEIYQQGGIGGRVRFSSVWETTFPLTWFVPISGIDDKVVLTQINSTTIKAEAVLDHNALPVGNITYDIVARIYEVEKTPDPEFDKTMTDGTFKTTTDGNIKSIA